MAELRVIQYGLAWQPSTNTGRIVLGLEGVPEPFDLDVNTAQEFAAIAAVLDRQAVVYDGDLGILRSQEQLVG